MNIPHEVIVRLLQKVIAMEQLAAEIAKIIESEILIGGSGGSK